MDLEDKSQELRILLVEDNEHDQVAFERSLKRSGMSYDLTVCSRAEDIARSMQMGSDAFDMVVVDYSLPGQNGLEAYRNLSRETRLPPFVMLTGTGSESLAVDALKAGMYDYIIKDPNQGYLYLLPVKLLDVKQRYEDRVSRIKAKTDLKKAHAELEETVKLRTIDLAHTVEALQDEVNERREAEKALMQSEQALRRLSVKIVETQENERRLLSKELHDSIGGSLAAIKFALEDKLRRMRDDPPSEAVSIEKIIGHVLDTIREVRRISTSLRPSMLDDLGLLATSEWYCRSSGEMYADTRIETKFEISEDDVPEIAKIVIYRVMQEALNNALRHSGADTIQVTLEKAGDWIRMCVIDNGSGFEPEHEFQSDDPLSGYGLQGMRDRAEIIGGTLSIESTPGKGTVVCLDLPSDLDPGTA